MDTSDTVVEVKKRGRPKKQDTVQSQDPETPQGKYLKEQADLYRQRKEENQIVEKFYELNRNKLSLAKKTSGGSVYRTFIGNIDDKKTGADLRAFVEDLKAKGQLRQKI